MPSAPLTSADWAMWRDLSAMRRTLERAIEQRLQADAAVSTPEFEVLSSLASTSDGRLRAGALAEALGWEKSRISHQVSRMESRGLVTRAECPSDARGTWVVLTAAGRDAFARAASGYAAVLESRLFTRISDVERTAMHAVAARVATDAADPAAGGCAARAAASEADAASVSSAGLEPLPA